MATLESIYGIDISYYARVNFTSLIKIVDAIGGVDVDSKYSFSAGGYTFTEGMNHLNGEQALAFSRERHSFAEGDNQRGKNQEAVLTGILQKAMSPALLVNASEIITSVSDSVETNMTRAEMATFISRQLSDGSSWTSSPWRPWEPATARPAIRPDRSFCMSCGRMRALCQRSAARWTVY